jgi:hypothetical protein
MKRAALSRGFESTPGSKTGYESFEATTDGFCDIKCGGECPRGEVGRCREVSLPRLSGMAIKSCRNLVIGILTTYTSAGTRHHRM